MPVPVFILTGLTQTGLFRIAGDRRRVRELKKSIDDGIDYLSSHTQRTPHHNLMMAGTFHLVRGCFNEEKPHELCALFKLYLRELPQSLFTFALTEEWLDAAWCEDTSKHTFVHVYPVLLAPHVCRQEEEDQPALYQALVKKMPRENATLLEFVVNFLKCENTVKTLPSLFLLTL